MNRVFLSARGRVLINAEALNMTESVGNYVKHRRVPALLPEAGYATFFVPAISGESVAHGYQQVLAELGLKQKKPVCNLCSRGIFLKSTNRSVFASQFREKLEDSAKNNEKFDNAHIFECFVVRNCIVEDIGGFLFAPGQQEKFEKPDDRKLLTSLKLLKETKKTKKIKDLEGDTDENEEESTEVRNVKRTSNFFTGYMIPVREALRSSIIEPQIHSRYALGTPFVERGQQGQMIYDVELSSAVYGFSFDLDTKFIGKATYSYAEIGKVIDDARERVELSLDAFEIFVKEMLFGAKRTRFLPVIDWESIVIAVSEDIWTAPSPFSINYLVNSLEKAKKFRPSNLRLFVYVNKELISKISAGSVGIEVVTKELLKHVRDQLDKKKEDMKEVFSDQYQIIEEKFATLTQDILRDLIEKEVQRLISEKLLRDMGNEEILNELKKFLDSVEEYKKTEVKTENLVRVFETLEDAVSNAIKYAKELQVRPA